MFGNTLAVSAVGDSSSAVGIDGDQTNNDAIGSGAVYMFSGHASTWTQWAYIKASNTGTDDLFGHSVSLSADALAVSAIWEDSAAKGINGNQNDEAGYDSGAVYVFAPVVP